MEFENFSVVNVYGYANASAETKRVFYQTISLAYLRPFDEAAILLGDFNENLVSAKKGGCNKQLTDLITGMKFVNTFGQAPQKRQAFTFRSTNGQSHIENIFINENNSGRIVDFKIVPYAVSDHELVMIDINMENSQTKARKTKSAY